MNLWVNSPRINILGVPLGIHVLTNAGYRMVIVCAVWGLRITPPAMAKIKSGDGKASHTKYPSDSHLGLHRETRVTVIAWTNGCGMETNWKDNQYHHGHHALIFHSFYSYHYWHYCLHMWSPLISFHVKSIELFIYFRQCRGLWKKTIIMTHSKN